MIAAPDPVRVLSGSQAAPLLLTCEHASERLPERWSWAAADRWLRGTHWAFDLGAAELCSELAAVLEAPAVLADFTRLLVDPNRPISSTTLFRGEADGRCIELNRDVDQRERILRIEDYWQRYHRTVDGAVQTHRAPVLLAVHTFTPLYEGERRPFEVGVLFDAEQSAGEQLAASLARANFEVRLNEPYSGRGGFIYSVDRHARHHGRQALELEVRQDCAQDPAFRRELVARLARHRWGGG